MKPEHLSAAFTISAFNAIVSLFTEVNTLLLATNAVLFGLAMLCLAGREAAE